MKKHIKSDTIKIRLCTSCFNCKTKNGDIYCKLGVWKETSNNNTILYSPFDFNCPEWEEA
jgi:hypothetical protein